MNRSVSSDPVLCVEMQDGTVEEFLDVDVDELEGIEFEAEA